MGKRCCVEDACAPNGICRLSRSTNSSSLPRPLLDRFHISFEPIEAGVPNRALLDQPIFGVGHGSWIQTTGPNTSTLLGLHEAASFEHPDVLHQAGQRHGKRAGEFSDRRFALAQSREDRSSGRVGESAEHVVKLG